MCTNTADEVAEKILTALERNEFAKFYNGKFEEFIAGDNTETPRAVQRANIVGEIKRIFRL